MRDRFGHTYYRHTTDPTAQLAYVHYDDPRYWQRGGACIYGAERPGLQWEDSDRLRQWDSRKATQAWQEAQQAHGTTDTALMRQAYLSFYFGRPVTLVCLMGWIDAATFYPCYSYGFVWSDA